MTAQIGYDGLDSRGDPRPELLIDVARVQPEPAGDWVHLGRLGFRSTQRLWIGDVPGGVAVATWPAELKPQACYLYGGGLGSALVAAAIEHGWAVQPSPHIAFRTASAARRLYMSPSTETLDYVACWEDEDALSRVGGNYARGDVEHELWPWLKQMGFADDGDDDVLLRFLDEFLGNWPANMRPGLRFFRVWALDETAGLGSALADTIRSQFDAVFAFAHEPALQAASHSLDALPPGTGNRPAGKPRPVQRPDPLTCTANLAQLGSRGVRDRARLANAAGGVACWTGIRRQERRRAMASPYGSMKRILQADESILDAAFTAHTVRHGCKESGQCEARRAIRDARSSLRHTCAALPGSRSTKARSPRSPDRWLMGCYWSRSRRGSTSPAICRTR
jgi:hypothetical protein